jgi:hypothetical protein
LIPEGDLAFVGVNIRNRAQQQRLAGSGRTLYGDALARRQSESGRFQDVGPKIANLKQWRIPVKDC